MMKKSAPLVFGADFADYPIMQEMLSGLVDRYRLWVGGRSGPASIGVPGQPQTVSYFDWQPYQRPAAGEALHAAIDTDHDTFYSGARWAFERSLDRVFLAPLSSRESERYFWDLVTRLETVFRPCVGQMIVFFAHTPHFPWHIVFFHVCRRLGIACFIFKRTQIPDGMFFDTELVTQDAPQREARAPLDAAEILTALDEVSGRLERSREINRSAEKTATGSMGLALKWKTLRRFYKHRHAYRRQHYYRTTWWCLFRYAMRRDRERRGDMAYLQQHAARRAPEAPYIYFALHYQPERTTVPEGGIYHEQLHAIALLARALPPGWQLVVKEHPRQLGDRRPDLRCLHYARQTLYTGIARLENTVLLHAFVASGPVIANARLTASVNGSSVFEGLQQCVPGLTFVPTWHSRCCSAPAVGSAASIPELIRSLSAKTRTDVQDDVASLIRSQCRFWFAGANDDRAASLSGRTREELLVSMRRELSVVVDDVWQQRLENSGLV